ncbi:SMP-LTD domain-containing protein [Entamoeba marina]
MIITIISFLFCVLIGLASFLIMSFFLIFKRSPKAPVPLPQITPLTYPPSDGIPNIPSDWFSPTKLSSISSECILKTNADEFLVVLSCDGKHIRLTYGTQLLKIPIQEVQIQNVSFGGRKLSKKNFMRIIGKKPIYKNSDTIQIRFKHSYELEYWDKLLRELGDIVNGVKSSQTIENGIGRLHHKRLSEQLKSNMFGLSTSEANWCGTLHSKVQTKANEVLSKKISSNLRVDSLQFGNDVPYIKHPVVQCGKEPGDIIVDGTVDYTGPFGSTLQYDFHLFGISIILSFRVLSIVANIRTHIQRIPANTIWVSFHDFPNINLSCEMRIGSYVLKNNIYLHEFMKQCIHTSILKTCYSPQMIAIPIPNFSLIDVFDKKIKTNPPQNIFVSTTPATSNTNVTPTHSPPKQPLSETTKKKMKAPLPLERIDKSEIRFAALPPMDKNISIPNPPELELGFDRDFITQCAVDLCDNQQNNQPTKKKIPVPPPKPQTLRTSPIHNDKNGLISLQPTQPQNPKRCIDKSQSTELKETTISEQFLNSTRENKCVVENDVNSVDIKQSIDSKTQQKQIPKLPPKDFNMNPTKQTKSPPPLPLKTHKTRSSSDTQNTSLFEQKELPPLPPTKHTTNPTTSH